MIGSSDVLENNTRYTVVSGINSYIELVQHKITLSSDAPRCPPGTGRVLAD
jgi:hypothetical protein